MTKKIKVAKRHHELPPPYYVKAMEEVNGQSDRGAAIAGTAFLDLLLRGAIEQSMRPYLDLHDILFENRGILQDFSARIQIAFAFKIIGTGAYFDLMILRDIRNAFAHSADAFGFGREDLAALCDQLWYQRKTHYANSPNPKTSREKFVRTVELLADGLIELLTRPAHFAPPTFIQRGPPWKEVKPQSSPKIPKLRPSRGRPTPNQKNEK